MCQACKRSLRVLTITSDSEDPLPQRAHGVKCRGEVEYRLIQGFLLRACRPSCPHTTLPAWVASSKPHACLALDHDLPVPLPCPFCPNLVRVSVSLSRIVTAHQIIILRDRCRVHL
jgi:hypothetical protein